MIAQQQDQIAALQSQVRALLAAQGVPGADAAPSMRVYPNPSHGLYTIEIASTGATRYEVHDLGGRLIQQGSLAADAMTTALNLSSAAKGSYLLRVFSGQRLLATEKLIVE